ncbi:RH4 [Odocoileus adenovirus 1]|uniref:RH4 n=2 Tax=Deer atadenovirus A TaxID=2169706 RepID=A0A515MFT6_9ADEN|nr:RH4 [Odocoileus adenovirus 1]QDM55336.1 RH4 [Deer atadenovirus A]ASU50517.1 RH4 [Odocoileus adenovirus 1]ASU50544.1 RH4 [Odocoileus adenovirus 1]ASU50571.1 RH4 [Odocoileus adenovirus 1]
MKILLYLTSKEIALFVHAFPEFAPLLLDRYFLKQHLCRFSAIECNTTLNALRKKFVNDSFQALDIGTWWCNCSDLLPSGHCVACLLNPHLLLASPFHSYCFCLDHRIIWDYSDVVIWSGSSWPDPVGKTWPAYDCETFCSKKKKVLKKGANN